MKLNIKFFFNPFRFSEMYSWAKFQFHFKKE